MEQNNTIKKRIASIFIVLVLMIAFFPFASKTGFVNAESNISLTTTTVTCSRIKGYFTFDASSLNNVGIIGVGMSLSNIGYGVSIYPQTDSSGKTLSLDVNTTTSADNIVTIPFDTYGSDYMFDDGVYVIKLAIYLPKPLKLEFTSYSGTRTISHSWSSGSVVKEATCGSDGEKAFTCSKCNRLKSEIIPKTGKHNWDKGVETKAARYLSYGVRTFTCATCGLKRNETIQKLNASLVTPAKVKLSSAKVSGKKLTLTWKRVKKKTKGYQVAVKNKKTGAVKFYNVKAKKKSKISKKIKLKKGKYAVMVRAYNIINGETIYGPWSKVKAGRIK